MSFVSYAQNNEDALLWRALRHVQRGFFIDVGAGDPVAESVTKAFSLAGWRGINIEPSALSFARLVEDRPHDINLRMLATSRPGNDVYYSVDGGNGLSTTIAEYAENYRETRWSVDEVETPSDSLANLCATHVDGEIHFLKIDTEGNEFDVLDGADFGRFRPWIVVVEAIAPIALRTADGEPLPFDSTQIVFTHLEWEPLLTKADYTYACFDGLNRYYVAAEHPDLLESLAAPINVLDDVVSALSVGREEQHRRELASASESLQQATAERIRLEAEVALAHDSTQQAVAERIRLENVVAALTRELSASRVELDATYQQVYEASRALASASANTARAEEEVRVSREDALRNHESIKELQGAIAHLEGVLRQNDDALGAATHEVGQLESRIAHHADESARANAVQAELDAVYATKAWRLTKPLRSLRGLVRRRSPAG
jgi:FkbM family methyltransferase